MTHDRRNFVVGNGAVLLIFVIVGGAQADDLGDLNTAFKQARALAADRNYEAAAEKFETSLTLAAKLFGNGHENYGRVLFSYGNAMSGAGRYADAEKLLVKAVSIYEARYGKNHAGTADAVERLALVYMRQGRYDDAETYLRRALAVWTAVKGADHPDTADTRRNLGTVYWFAGRPEKAEIEYLQALRTLEMKLGKDDPETAKTRDNLGLVYTDLGQFDKAREMHTTALSTLNTKLGSDHADTVRAAYNLSRLLQHTGEYAEAERLLRIVLAFREKTAGKDHPETARSADALAVILARTGQMEEAVTLFRRGLVAREAAFGKDHPETAASCRNLANALDSLGRTDEALRFARRAVASSEATVGDHPHTAAGLRILAQLSAQTGDWDIAAGATDRARRITRKHAVRVLPALPDKQQYQFLRTDEADYFEALSMGLLRRDHRRERDLSTGWVLNGKAIAAQARAEKLLLARDASDPRAGRIAQRLAEARQALAAAVLGLPRPGGEDSRNQQVAELTKAEETVSRELTAMTGRQATAAVWVETPAVRAALPTDAVLVEVARFDQRNVAGKPGEKYSLGERYVAWVIPASGDVTVVDLGPAAAIDAAVKAARAELNAAPKSVPDRGEPNAETAVKQPLMALAKLVLHPLLPAIRGSKSWVVSPDGNLWLVPWAALPLPDGRYVVEDHALRYVATGRDLLTPRNTAVKTTAPVVLADPDFDLGSADAAVETRKLVPDSGGTRGLSQALGLGRVKRLPGTGEEAEAIAPKLEAVYGIAPKLFTDRQALPGVFKAVHSPRAAVLGTHGFFLDREKSTVVDAGAERTRAGSDVLLGAIPENPLLRCGLLLAGCNNRRDAADGGETGVLTGLEIVGTDLRGTELVVLSACETGLGEVQNGEGVAGLRQAFQLAGAESVVSTLWQVPDVASAQLMVAFFDGLANGRPRATALAESQREVIRKRRDRFGAAHPFFWAAYTVTGRD